MSETKPFKSKVETYEFDGKVVTMTSLPVDQKSYGGGAMRAKWKIEIDGELRAYAFFPNGYGGKWHVYSLMGTDYFGDPDKAVRPWEFDETGYTDGYQGLMGRLKGLKAISVYGDMDSPGRPHPLSWTPLRNSDGTLWPSHRNAWEGRKEIAAGIVHVPFSDLPTKEVVLAEYEAEKERAAERKRQDEANKARWAREREEQAERARLAAEEAERRRLEVLEGLTSIRANHGAILSNHETDALVEAIKKFGGEA